MMRWSLLAALTLAVSLGAWHLASDETRTGTDERAMEGIDKQMAIEPLWTPEPSAEALLFAIQAAAGMGILLWSLRHARGTRKR